MAVAAETNPFANLFERAPVEANGRAWLGEVRQRAWEAFLRRGVPTPAVEEWKFTNLAAALGRTAFEAPVPLELPRGEVDAAGLGTWTPHRLVFLNGFYRPELSTPPPGVRAGSLAGDLEAEARPFVERFGTAAEVERYPGGEPSPMSLLNAALTRDGAAVFVPPDTVLDEPLHVLLVSGASQHPIATFPRHLFVLGAGSKATVVLHYAGVGEGTYFTDAVADVVLGENATLRLLKVQRESRAASHVDSLRVHAEAGSTFRACSVSLGAALSRHEIHAPLRREGIHCALEGLYVATGRQHVDNFTVIDHLSPRCSCNETYRGVLDGQAHGVFSGQIWVRQDAQQTDARQSDKNLLLSEDAVVNAKPQLMIFADDVKCAHGVAIGTLEPDALFYLRARGIGEAEARAMLTEAFAREITDTIEIEPLRAALEAQVRAMLEVPR